MEDEKKTQMHVNCSPKMFKEVQNDTEFATDIKMEIFSEEDSVDEVVFAATEDSCTGKAIWKEAQVKLLLDFVGENMNLVGKTCQLKNKRKMWKLISEKLALKGHVFSAQKVEIKFRALERQYKKAKMINEATGRNRVTCPFFKELDEILGQHKSQSPEYILDAATTEQMVKSEEHEDFFTHTDGMPGCSKAKRKRGSVIDDLLQKLDDIKTDRQEFQNTIKDYLNEKRERERRKEDRSIEKLELLKKLLQKE